MLYNNFEVGKVSKDHESLKITKAQRRNLKTLADFLARSVPPPHFDISSYISANVRNVDDDDNLEGFGDDHWISLDAIDLKKDLPRLYSHCGTTACAIGHGPLVGIKPRKGEDWDTYAYRVFTNSNQDIFNFCFGPEWSAVDNTPQGAAARIYYILKKGLPEDTMAADVDISIYEKYRPEMPTGDNCIYVSEISDNGNNPLNK